MDTSTIEQKLISEIKLNSLQAKIFLLITCYGKMNISQIAEKLNTEFFFAHPYSSWERGLNENSNGLLRQYYPRKTDLRGIDRTTIYPVLEKINNRPRKTLGYATPKEVFF